MGRLNPEKFSQRLQDLNRYLDFIPIEKTSDSLKVTKAYGKSLPEDELRSIMGRAIPPEWTVNLLSLGKEPWKFRDLDDHLNVYCQQWQADQQKQIISQMAGKHPNKSNDGKIKSSDKNHHNFNGGRGSNRHGNTARGGRGRGRVGRGGRGKIVSIYRMSNALFVARKTTIPLTVPSRKRTMNVQTLFPKRISKTCFKLQ
jgi:hypothetical protein